MKFRILLPVLAVMLLLAGRSFAAQELVGAGATFPEPLYTKMFDSYFGQTANRINYQGIGSGGGIQQLLQQTVDFAGSDAFLGDAEMGKMKGAVLHVPTCIGAVVVTYNLPGNPSLKMTPEVLADIFLGRITTWNDNRIAQLNQGVKLPGDRIFVVHRSDGSGTTFVFSDYLSKVSGEWKNRVGVGKSLKWPVGLGGKGNPGVAQLVKQTRGGIGYVELTYAEKNRMAYASIRNQAGAFIKPSLKSASLAASAALPADTRISITNTSVKEGYPISTFTWILVYREQSYAGRDVNKAKALVRLLWWMTHEGQQYAPELLYSPIPKDAVKKAETILKSMTFNGQPVMK